MATITPKTVLDNMYTVSPHMVDDFFETLEKKIATGEKIIFTATNEKDQVISSVDELLSFRKSFEGGDE